jgi:hypothetical protein
MDLGTILISGIVLIGAAAVLDSFLRVRMMRI